MTYTPQNFVNGLQDAGASPLVLPIGTRNHAKQYVSMIDGLLLTGGYDVDPNLYNEHPIPQLQATFPQRDTFELALIEAALEKGIPILGICRGMQLLNVYYGGSLYQDLPSQFKQDQLQHVQVSSFDIPVHRIEVEPTSHLHTITGSSLMVNTFHHQGIKVLGEGLRAVATTADGLIEAFEAENILALQWHPETMLPRDPISQQFFQDLVDRSKK